MNTLNPAIDVTDPIGGFSFGQVISAIRRRLRPMSIVFAVVFLAFLAIAMLWPPTYRSTGTILIEQQEIPTEFVRSAVSSYADQRVQMISQRVMTSVNLIGIVDKYKLYPTVRATETRETLIDRMRKDIQLNMISAEVMDPRQGRATKATIAFSVSYDSRTPGTAAQVANELTSLYLSENIETRKQLAADTAGFLGEEASRLGARVAELESKISEFKQANGERLPEYTQFNLEQVDRSRQELRDIDMRVRSLDQQITYLDAQMVQLDPTASVYTETGERVMSPRDRLKVLKAQYASALAVYNEDHPDVRRYKREIEGLEAQVGGSSPDDMNETARRLNEARGELAAAKQRYGDEHPDVQRLQREIRSLETALKNVPTTATSRRRDEGADNPAYIQLQAQRSAAGNDRTALQAQAAEVRARLSKVEQLQAAAPGVEREYNALMRDLNNEQAKYAEVRQKQMEAQLVQNLETERKGERFTLIEPPLVPSVPISPNRNLLVALGFMLAVGGALALMFLMEQVDTRIRDRSHLLRLVGVPPLAIVPYVHVAEEVSHDRKVRWGAGGVVLLLIGGALALVHFFVMPLDVLAFGLLRRFGL